MINSFREYDAIRKSTIAPMVATLIERQAIVTDDHIRDFASFVLNPVTPYHEHEWLPLEITRLVKHFQDRLSTNTLATIFEQLKIYVQKHKGHEPALFEALLGCPASRNFSKDLMIDLHEFPFKHDKCLTNWTGFHQTLKLTPWYQLAAKRTDLTEVLKSDVTTMMEYKTSYAKRFEWIDSLAKTAMRYNVVAKVMMPILTTNLNEFGLRERLKSPDFSTPLLYQSLRWASDQHHRSEGLILEIVLGRFATMSSRQIAVLTTLEIRAPEPYPEYLGALLASEFRSMISLYKNLPVILDRSSQELVKLRDADRNVELSTMVMVTKLQALYQWLTVSEFQERITPEEIVNQSKVIESAYEKMGGGDRSFLYDPLYKLAFHRKNPEAIKSLLKIFRAPLALGVSREGRQDTNLLTLIYRTATHGIVPVETVIATEVAWIDTLPLQESKKDALRAALGVVDNDGPPTKKFKKT